VCRMLLIILALFWVALLAPTVVRRFRDNGAERSIESFHAEHQVLSRQGYIVPPAHRLDQSDEREPSFGGANRKPRLTVVHADDTYRSLESRNSWDEWSEDYNYDDEPSARREVPRNRYAAAYSAVPSGSTIRTQYEPRLRRRSMKAQRKMVFGRLVLSAVALTIIAFVSGYSLIMDLAILTWVGVVTFVALALYAVSQGYLHESSLPLRLPQRRTLATIQPLYDEYPPRLEDEFESDFYEPDSNVRWQRESQSRRALG
jgi:hypothetical protein